MHDDPRGIAMLPLRLEDLNLAAAERQLCDLALRHAGQISDAAELLGISRHALRRKMIKHGIRWPRPDERDDTAT